MLNCAICVCILYIYIYAYVYAIYTQCILNVYIKKKKKKKKKKKNPGWGLAHPPTSEFFSDFFTLTKPLKIIGLTLNPARI